MKILRPLLCTICAWAAFGTVSEASALSTSVSLIAKNRGAADLTVTVEGIPSGCQVLQLVGLSETRVRTGGVERTLSSVKDVRSFKVKKDATRAVYTFTKLKTTKFSLKSSYYIEAVCRMASTSPQRQRLLATSSSVGGITSQCENDPKVYVSDVVGQARTTRVRGGAIKERYFS